MSKEIKALVLFSGGLDSMLAVKILEEQGIKVRALTFKSCFFDEAQAKKSAKENSIDLKVIDFSKKHLELIKSPQHGYGKSMNPCIDCHIFMLKEAKKYMKEEDFDFIATGEVLGQRPMSQNIKSLRVVEKESSLNGLLLRPLSAKILEETIPEKRGFVNRINLFDISGRQRKKQIELAEKFKIKKYPSPAGGCLLTDFEFGERLMGLFINYPKCNKNDVELLKYGRHFWKEKVKIIVGRDERENKRINSLIRKNDVLIEMKNYSGPVTLVRNYGKKRLSDGIMKTAKQLTQYYSAKARGQNDVDFKIKNV
jgi:tRNA-uridine 2-sulfurtransferase